MAENSNEIRDVKNKIVVVTGGMSGIGLSIVKKLLNSQAKHVAAFDLDNDNSRNVFNDLHNEYQNRIGFHICDVTKTEMIAQNFDKVIESHGTIDILVNNAGIAEENKPELMIDINLKALIMATYKFIERFGKHKGGKGGVIVNIASTLGFLSNPVGPCYAATKHGVVGFTRCVQPTYDVTGIRLIAICPGFTETPMIEKHVFLDFVRKTNEFDNIHMQSPNSVANAVVEVIAKGRGKDAVFAVIKDEPPFPVAQKENMSDFI